MRQPQQREKSKESFVPLKPSKFSENVTKFYEKLHALDVKYTAALFETVQEYSVLRVASKVIAKLSDGPALPFFYLLYWLWKNPSPLLFAFYLALAVLFHEFVIKRIFHRHRPDTAGGQKGFSFPSSHSFASGLIIITCLFFSFPLSWLLIFLALLNAANRPAVGVHYIADVVAGLALGVVAGLLWYVLLGLGEIVSF